MSDMEFVDAAIKQQHKLHECQARIREQRELLDECVQALMAIDRDNNNPKRFSYRIADIVSTTLAKFRAAQENADE